ncbi:unnamed protein product [Aphis gossypii]|uniref:Uncharacterized protein n=1 Tax=Aphis gossypii TaxID=80765 RepID=A0A9P0NDT8_APHGO|nr:unnamed protein product [Aphis gossypii]
MFELFVVSPVPHWPTCTEGQDKMKNFIRGGAEIESCSQFRNSRVTGHCYCRTVQCSLFGLSEERWGFAPVRRRENISKPSAHAQAGSWSNIIPIPKTTSLLSLISHPTDNEISLIRIIRYSLRVLRQFILTIIHYRFTA